MHESDQVTQLEAPEGGKTCGHAHHVGTCASCQRAQLHRWRMQLVSAKPAIPAGRH